MDIQKEPEKKKAPMPSAASVAIADYFELQLIDIAVKAYKNKEYLKSAMMSWSFIEEFFLPRQIEFIAKNQKINIDKDMLENTNAFQLIRYYFLISYDEELYKLLNEARKLRNQIIHKSYKSGSISEIAKKAQESSKYNLYTLMSPALDRLKGEIPPPSLTLYSKGWNDYRAEMKEILTGRINELRESSTESKGNKD
jgi:hypothetical protein